MRILLVEDNPGDVRMLREHLAEAGAGRFELTHVDRLSTGLERLADTSFDAVALDLSLPDSQGPATLARMHAAAKGVPIVVLTGIEDEALGVQLVKAGAQDYLVKGRVTGPLLTRALRYAIERKAMEEALRRAEEKYRSIFDNAVEGVFQSTPSGRYLSVNPALARMYGYESPDALMRSVTDIEHEIYVDPNCRTELRRLLERRGIVRGFEYEVFRRDGSTIWISESVRAVRDAHGAVLYYEGTIEDITERKQAGEALRESEERFRAIMENSSAMIFLKDPEGRYLLVNRKFEESFHVANRDLVGKTDQDIFPPEQAAAFRANDRKVFEAGRPFEFEEVALHDDGSHTSIVVKFPLLNAQGQCYALCGITTDITDRKRSEERLQRTLGELRTLSQRLDVVREEERTRIARELHDELGVRLTCLKLDLARLQSLMGGPLFLREKMEEKMRFMTAEVDSTIASVQRLVAELRPGILDDLGLVAAIEWQCQDFERRSGMRCVCEASQEEVPLDRSHATAAFRICQEALTNVVRHAEAISIRVLVEQVNGELRLEIQDDGKGITAEQLADSASLGLLGMRERARGLGGRLEIAPGRDKGTTVTLRLPLT